MNPTTTLNRKIKCNKKDVYDTLGNRKKVLGRAITGARGIIRGATDSLYHVPVEKDRAPMIENERGDSDDGGDRCADLRGDG